MPVLWRVNFLYIGKTGERRNLERLIVVPCAEHTSTQVAMRPKVSFDSKNIWRRLEMCKAVAQAYGWDSKDIMKFVEEVSEAFSYEEAMAIIKRDFDTIEECDN
jgi:hypothetical protein